MLDYIRHGLSLCCTAPSACVLCVQLGSKRGAAAGCPGAAGGAVLRLLCCAHNSNNLAPSRTCSYVRYSYFGIALNELTGLVLTCTPEQLA